MIITQTCGKRQPGGNMVGSLPVNGDPIAMTFVGSDRRGLDCCGVHAPYFPICTYMRALPYRVVLVETVRSEEHTSELQSLMRISSAVFCLYNKMKSSYT